LGREKERYFLRVIVEKDRRSLTREKAGERGR